MLIVIPGEPTPLSRHKTIVCEGKAIHYDGQKKEKRNFAVKARALIGDLSAQLLSREYYNVEILFEMPFPKSKRRKKMVDIGLIPHVCKPDIDNLIKFVFDALNGICWEDDRRILAVNAKKVYSENPCTKIYIKPV